MNQRWRDSLEVGACLAGILGVIIQFVILPLRRKIQAWCQRRKEAKANEFHAPPQPRYSRAERKEIEKKAKELESEWRQKGVIP